MEIEEEEEEEEEAGHEVKCSRRSHSGLSIYRD